MPPFVSNKSPISELFSGWAICVPLLKITFNSKPLSFVVLYCFVFFSLKHKHKKFFVIG
jgi:hypothetical protein